MVLFISESDINECEEQTDRCAQNCINSAGSYSCTCNSGYRLQSNGFSCNGKFKVVSAVLIHLSSLIQILMNVLKILMVVNRYAQIPLALSHVTVTQGIL